MSIEPADRLHETAAALLGAVGQRYTRGRRGLVDALAGTARPVAVPDLLAAAAGAAQSSAYRNMAVLEAAGVVRRVHGEDGFCRFELAEGLTGHHHHLHCDGCGRVADYTLPEGLERAVERAMAEVTSRTGFRPRDHTLDLVGLCAACA